jgi:hypothetical protein
MLPWDGPSYTRNNVLEVLHGREDTPNIQTCAHMHNTRKGRNGRRITWTPVPNPGADYLSAWLATDIGKSVVQNIAKVAGGDVGGGEHGIVWLNNMTSKPEWKEHPDNQPISEAENLLNQFPGRPDRRAIFRTNALLAMLEEDDRRLQGLKAVYHRWYLSEEATMVAIEAQGIPYTVVTGNEGSVRIPAPSVHKLGPTSSCSILSPFNPTRHSIHTQSTINISNP